MAEEFDIGEIDLTQVGPFSQEQPDTSINLAQAPIQPTDAAYEVSIGRSLDEKNAVENWKKSFNLDELNQRAAEANMTNKQILDYALETFPGTVDIEGLRAAGYDDANLLELFLGYRSEMGAEAIGKGTQMGMVEAAPPLVGGLMAGVTATSVTANPLIGLGVGVVTGLALTPPGQYLKNLLFGGEPFTPDARAFGEAGRTGGMGALTMIAPHHFARNFSPGSATVSNNIDFLARSKNPFAPILESYAKKPGMSTYIEGTSLMGASTGAYLAERSYPGQPLPRFAFETTMGVFSPARAIARLGEGVYGGIKSTLNKYVLPEGQQFEQGSKFLEYIKKNNGDPEKILRDLQSYEEGTLGIQKLAEDLGVDLKPVKTINERTGVEEFKSPTMSLFQATQDPAIKKLFQTMLSDKRYGPTIEKAIDMDYITLGSLIDIMQRTGNPALLEQASLMKEDLMRGLIVRLLQTKNDKAKSTVDNLIKRSDINLGPRTSEVVKTLTEQALTAARKQEKLFYEVVDGKEVITLDNFLAKFKENQEKLLAGEIDFLPTPVKGLILRTQGSSLDEAATVDSSIANLQKKVTKGNEKIGEINAIYPDDVAFVNRIIEDGNYNFLSKALSADINELGMGKGLPLEAFIQKRKDFFLQFDDFEDIFREGFRNLELGKTRQTFDDNPLLRTVMDDPESFTGKELAGDSLAPIDNPMYIYEKVFQAFKRNQGKQEKGDTNAITIPFNTMTKLSKQFARSNFFLEQNIKNRTFEDFLGLEPDGYNMQSAEELAATIEGLKKHGPAMVDQVFQEQIQLLQTKGVKTKVRNATLKLVKDHVKTLEKLLKLKKDRPELFDDDRIISTADFKVDSEFQAATQVRNVENFDDLPPAEKLRVQLEEIQKHIAGFERPFIDPGRTTGPINASDQNVAFLIEQTTGKEFKIPTIRKNRIINLLKEKAKIVNNELSLIEARNNFSTLGDETPVEEITLQDGMRARSLLLTAMRQKLALGGTQDLNAARVLGELADSLKDDFGIKVGGDDPTGETLADLTTNQLKLRDAYMFSKALNDVFTRAFPNSMVAKDRLGADFNIPELLHSKIFTGGGDSTALKYDQMLDAMSFLADNVGANFNEFTVKQVGSLRAAQNDLLRVAARAVIDPSTGRVNETKLNTFLERYKPVLYNEDGSAKFPEFLNDISSVEKAQNSFEVLLGKTGDPRIAETGVSELGKGIPSKGIYQKKLNNTVSYANFIKGNANAQVKSVIPNPGERSGVSSKNLERLIKQALRAETKFPGAANGLRDIILEQARFYATGKANKQGFKFTNFAQMKDYLMSPFEGQGPSVLEIMRTNGLMSNDEAIRLNTLLNDSIKIQNSFMGGDGNIDLKLAAGDSLPIGTVGNVLRKVVRIFSLSQGGALGSYIPGRSQGLAEPLIVADLVDDRIFKIPEEALGDFFLEGVFNPSAFKLMMQKGTLRQDKIKLSKSLNSYLFSSGLISAQSYEDFLKERKEEEENVVIPLNAPEIIREDRPRTTNLEPAPVEISQAIPAQSSALPTTNIASVSPSLNPVPTASGPVNRERFAALFPEDRGLIEASGKQGIGSLFG
jgi:hypothetical protein